MSAANAMALTGADQTLTSTPGFYKGFSVRETTGAGSAALRIYDNTSAAGTILETISLVAGESASDFFADEGLRFNNGLFVKIVSGSVEGSVRIG